MPYREVYCIRCAAKNPAEGNYCFNCGHMLFKRPKTVEAPTTNGSEAGAEAQEDRITVGMTVADVEQRLILKTLVQVGNKTRAAAILGVSLKTLHNKLNEYRQRGLWTE